ncbi:MAG: FAD-dependent thymidylate synthase [Candidatus Sungbacteria bacterium]|nr:FAD-dependent thymidylate synthase [Candidatus Sungbacteria bacterium]
MKPSEEFAPIFKPDDYTAEECKLIAPFFTNLDKSVYVPLIFAPELIGALCSRTSRAADDLRLIFLKEFIGPFLNPACDPKDTDESFAEKEKYGRSLAEFVEFLQKHPFLEIFSNPKARAFYVKWLAEYGDDSIAQMAGMHLVFTGISQVAIKHLEDQRIGLAPIEKSTRYVNYSKKAGGSYLYYTDPTLKEMGLEAEYRTAMDGLFETYTRLIPRLTEWLQKRFSEEKPAVVEKKAFDTLRGLLPVSTLSQVAFFGNGQAFEYLITRSSRHALGEIRWVARMAYQELNTAVPSFLRRIEQENSKNYQEYLAKKGERVFPLMKDGLGERLVSSRGETEVFLIEYDPRGEEKIITGILFSAPRNHLPWEEIFMRVQKMSTNEKRKIIAAYLGNRTERWQRVGRAFENAYVRFEIAVNIGAWRDLHRHRMLTQMRQDFSCYHGYHVPPEITEAGLTDEFSEAIKKAEDVFYKISRKNPALAQYAVTLAHRVRFMQWENLRECFWEMELRSIPEGHPDYRHIAQEKFKLLEKAYPLIAEHMRVNMGEYDFARRGQEEKIQKKLQQLAF